MAVLSLRIAVEAVGYSNASRRRQLAVRRRSPREHEARQLLPLDNEGRQPSEFGERKDQKVPVWMEDSEGAVGRQATCAITGVEVENAAIQGP